jgi:RNA processing factor Prp31
MCFNEDGSIRPKADCRAAMINTLILEDMMDIDEAENLVDKSLREWNLWGEPTLEELLKDDEPEKTA